MICFVVVNNICISNNIKYSFEHSYGHPFGGGARKGTCQILRKKYYELVVNKYGIFIFICENNIRYIFINLNLRFFYIDPHKILPMGAHEHSNFLSHVIVDVDLLKSHICSYRLHDT